MSARSAPRPRPAEAPTVETPSPVRPLPADRLVANAFSVATYGDPAGETDGLLESIRERGVLVPLVVTRAPGGRGWEVISGHRRLACARAIGLAEVPCQVSAVPPGADRERAVLDYNRQRDKTFSQRMREADALDRLLGEGAAGRSRANLRRGENPAAPDGRNPDARGRTDAAVARAVGLGGKDLYRQARAVWRAAAAGDARAVAAVAQLDAGTKTVFAAYKDLRRRDRFTSGFRPTPYDVWPFRHDDAFGVPHPGAIPAGIVAHAVHYFSPPGGLVVDPMAGGGTTVDVCQAMGRRCLAYDLHPVRPEVRPHDLRGGLPPEAAGCDLLFCDPPYHTMLAGRYPGESVSGVGELPLAGWIAFLQSLSRDAFSHLRPGGHVALLLANQTEKDLPAGQGYLDHAFLGYGALLAAGFQPVRRISCPMAGGYRPQQVRRAREDGRLLGLVRDLVVMRKPVSAPAPAAQTQTGSPFRIDPVW
jgi:ParB-like chromosome segregation protein Spo0J